jgi:hypothetical protein
MYAACARQACCTIAHRSCCNFSVSDICKGWLDLSKLQYWSWRSRSSRLLQISVREKQSQFWCVQICYRSRKFVQSTGTLVSHFQPCTWCLARDLLHNHTDVQSKPLEPTQHACICSSSLFAVVHVIPVHFLCQWHLQKAGLNPASSITGSWRSSSELSADVVDRESETVWCAWIRCRYRYREFVQSTGTLADLLVASSTAAYAAGTDASAAGAAAGVVGACCCCCCCGCCCCCCGCWSCWGVSHQLPCGCCWGCCCCCCWGQLGVVGSGAAGAGCCAGGVGV